MCSIGPLLTQFSFIMSCFYSFHFTSSCWIISFIPITFLDHRYAHGLITLDLHHGFFPLVPVSDYPLDSSTVQELWILCFHNENHPVSQVWPPTLSLKQHIRVILVFSLSFYLWQPINQKVLWIACYHLFYVSPFLYLFTTLLVKDHITSIHIYCKHFSTNLPLSVSFPLIYSITAMLFLKLI